MKQRIGVFLLVGLICCGSGAAAETSDPSAPLDGCEYFTGRGEGQSLVPVTPESAGMDRGTIRVVSQVSGRAYTILFKGVSFPPSSVGAGGESKSTIYVTWRILENGVRGVNRLHATSFPPDPETPTKLFFIGEAEVLDGNRYKSGGAYMVGELDLLTGSYTLENYNLVLCRAVGRHRAD